MVSQYHEPRIEHWNVVIASLREVGFATAQDIIEVRQVIGKRTCVTRRRDRKVVKGSYSRTVDSASVRRKLAVRESY